MKYQSIRLIDVFLFGPAMIAIGLRRNVTETERAFLIVGGLFTMIFNGANYLEIEREKTAQT